MPTIQSTLSLARRALIAQQAAMAVASNNIANVNTPGYARRLVTFTPLGGSKNDNGRWGGGVELTNIRSIRDPFIEQQFRRSLGESAWYQTESRNLALVEGMLGGLGDTGLVASLDRFWNSWHELASDPTSDPQRATVRESARNLTNQMRNIQNRLFSQEEMIAEEIETKISRVNTIIAEIANLNRQMLQARVDVSEMGDQRSILLDELSSLTGAEYRMLDNGAVTVYIGGVNIVERTNYREIEQRPDVDGSRGIFIKDVGNTRIDIRAGEIGALEEVRTEDLGEMKRQLDEFALTLVSVVNNIHVNGFGKDGNNGRFFFNPNTTGMKDIALDPEIEDNLDAIAASMGANGSDNEIALAIAEIQTSVYMTEGGVNLGDAMRSLMTWVGARVANAEDLAKGSELAVQQIASWRDSVSGVSLDEEMTEMVKYQHAFNAAAKVINAMDNMMNTLLTII